MPKSIKEFNADAVGVDNGNYFGMPFTVQDAELVLLSAAWDVTVSYGDGCAAAPEAIIEASTQLDFYDPMAVDAWRKGIATAPIDSTILARSKALRSDAKRVIAHLEAGGSSSDKEIVTELGRVNAGCAELNQKIEIQATEYLSQGKRVGLVGGDHSTPYGLIKALSKVYTSFGVLHLDAHCDLRKAYEGFEFSHASIMYNVLRDMPQVERLVQVATRDFCEAEARIVATNERIVSFDDWSLTAAMARGEGWDAVCQRIVEALPQKVYVSFDIDALSPDNCPNTGTPVSGGLSFNQALWLLYCLKSSGREIIGFDVVEVSPDTTQRIDTITGARILWKMCGQILK